MGKGHPIISKYEKEDEQMKAVTYQGPQKVEVKMSLTP